MDLPVVNQVKARHPLLLSNKRHNFHRLPPVPFGSVKSIVRSEPNFDYLKCSILSRQNNPAIPSNVEAQCTISNSGRNQLEKCGPEGNPLEESLICTIKWFKTSAVVIGKICLMSLILLNARALAVASPVAEEYSSSVTPEIFHPASQSLSYGYDGTSMRADSYIVVCCLILFIFWVESAISVYKQNQIRLIKVEVGLLDRATGLDLNLMRIAKHADISTSRGRVKILREIAQMLLNNIFLWEACFSSVKLCGSIEDAEKCIEQLSSKDRGKFDEELDNLNKIKEMPSSNERFSNNLYMVVTVLVAAKGQAVTKYPLSIADEGKLMDALKQLQMISRFGEIQALNVLWAPKNGSYIKSVDELIENYPNLRIFNIY